MTATMTATDIWLKGQAKSVEESSEAWRRNDAGCRDSHFVGILMNHMAALGASFEDIVRVRWQDLQRSPATYPAQETGEWLSKVLATGIRLFDQVEECVRACEANGDEVPGAEKFRAAHDALVSLNERFLDGWPMLDVKAAEQAQADARAGRFFTLEDIARAVDNPVQR